MIRTVTTILGAGAAGLLMTSSAQAELSFCNETAINASVAIGYLNGDQWTSEGWWTVAPSSCVTVVNDPQPQSYYYWHALNKDGEFASEDYYFCAVDDVFTIIGDTDCEARGHNQASFSEIQIPANGVSQVQLTAALAPAAPAPSKAPSTAIAKPSKSEEQAARQYSQPSTGNNAEVALDVARSPEPAPEPEPELTPPAEPSDTPVEAISEAPQVTAVPSPTLTLARNIPTSELLATTPVDFPAIKQALLGTWHEEGGTGYSSEIEPGRFVSFENDTQVADGTWRLAATCPEAPGPGPAIISVITDSTEKDCMIIDILTDEKLRIRHPTKSESYSLVR